MRSHVDQSQNHVFDQTWMNENVVNINMSVLTKQLSDQLASSYIFLPRANFRLICQEAAISSVAVFWLTRPVGTGSNPSGGLVLRFGTCYSAWRPFPFVSLKEFATTLW